jgi:hypothetical protein
MQTGSFTQRHKDRALELIQNMICLNLFSAMQLIKNVSIYCCLGLLASINCNVRTNPQVVLATRLKWLVGSNPFFVCILYDFYEMAFRFTLNNMWSRFLSKSWLKWHTSLVSSFSLVWSSDDAFFLFLSLYSLDILTSLSNVN